MLSSPAAPPRSERPSVRRWSRRVAADFVGFADVAAVMAGSAAPALIYAHTSGAAANMLVVVQAALVTAIIVYGCLRNWGMYDTTRMDDFPSDPMLLLGALAVSMVALLGVGLPFAPSDVHLYVWYGTWLSASFTCILAARIAARVVLARYAEAGRFDTRVAVFGAGAIALRVNDYLARNRLGIEFVGTFDDRIGGDRANPDGLVIAGKLRDLIELGRSGRVDQIIIALPQSADQRTAMIAARLQHLPVSIHVVTHLASDLVEAGPAHKVSALGTVGLLDVKEQPLSDWSPVVKQIEDYVLGTILLVLTLPLFALIIAAIKLDSAGPVLTRVRRRGLNSKVIDVIKFRTLKTDADDQTTEVATAADPRCTRVGRWLRRTGLDELPQLFNVLRGEMSLVGPRPHALVHDEQWNELLKNYAYRSQVKPGITGLAQIDGARGELTSADQLQARLEQDLAYIRGWSLALDLSIMGRTLGAILRARNAH